MAKLFAVVLLIWSVAAYASEFDRPWNDPQAALVLDPYGPNDIDWDKLQTDQRVVAIVHKATQGISDTDNKYAERKAVAKKRGYLWGSYHLGKHGNPEQQADHYIDFVKPGDDELIALDLEDIHSDKYMSADEALRFMARVKERTGRLPLVYINGSGTEEISKKFQGTAFAKTPLWYARPAPKLYGIPHGVWNSYTLWQFSSEILVQINIPGVHPDMDVNVFNGTKEALRSRWPLNAPN